ncbi:HD-GYP domain-containing protein [Pseudobacillus badius]|uniref:HD-GYP domain-containing protein n=1 Tax=Bacillus badius TaxID=1455 RepID=UPI0024A5A7BB|nr:HD domain-containing phosphohydrolase [Bacillus badius]GLY08785.1 HD family phosphohydrolase [Bacillus badius]
MYVQIEDLKEGDILLEDVFGKTQMPLMAKDTELTSLHIHMLKAFLVGGVEVAGGASAEKKPKDKELKEKPVKQAVVSSSEPADFFQQYLQSVENHKKEFQKWQAGGSIDIVKVREMIVPLLDQAIGQPEVFLEISNYSDPSDYISHHSIATGLISGMIAMQLNCEKGTVIQSALSGVLADCGMARVNPRILLKESSLTSAERKEVNNHPFFSYKMVKDINLLKPETKLAIFQHHERLDGSGYAKGVKADQLLLISRIVALADAFHAMTTDRPYRRRHLLFKVLEMFRQDFFGQFDLEAVKALTNVFTKLPSGTVVQLSDGQKATILFVKQQHPTRPLLQLQKDETIVDLEKRRDLYIESIL